MNALIGQVIEELRKTNEALSQDGDISLELRADHADRPQLFCGDNMWLGCGGSYERVLLVLRELNATGDIEQFMACPPNNAPETTLWAEMQGAA